MSDTTIKKPISEATAGEIRDFARIGLGLDDIKDGDSKQALLAKLSAAGYSLPTIIIPNPDLIPSEEDSNERGRSRRVNPKTGLTEVRIMIHKSEKAGGSRPVPVGVNGRMMMIPRGKPEWVPEHFVQVLENAVELHYPPYDGDADFLGGLKEPEKVSAYPFSFA